MNIPESIHPVGSEQAIVILDELLDLMIKTGGPVDRAIFRTKRKEHLDLMDQLESRDYIERNDNDYSVSPRSLLALKKTASGMRIIDACTKIYESVHQQYSKFPLASISVKSFLQIYKIAVTDYFIAYPFISRLSIFSRTTNHRQEDATITPSEQVLRCATFLEALERMFQFRGQSTYVGSFGESATQTTQANAYINPERISQLRELKHHKYDFARLIQICVEINFNYSNKNYLSVSVLLRMLVDHVSPIFNQTDFAAVVANWKGRSQKELFGKLEECKQISNVAIHAQISSKEILPNEQQIHFMHSIDALIGEIIKACEN